MNQKYVIKSPLTGNSDFDQNVADYRDNLVTWGCQPKKDGDFIIVDLVNAVSLDVNDFLFIMSKDDSEVSYFNPIIKIEESHIDDLIPENLPNSFNGDNLHTWKSWRSSEESYPLQYIDGFYYFISSTFGNTLTGKELLMIYNADGVELVMSLPESIN